MTSTLTFSLPEEQKFLSDALEGTSLKNAVKQFDSYLIDHIQLQSTNRTERAIYEQIRKELYLTLNDKNIQLR
jgi:hypothetical protein